MRRHKYKKDKNILELKVKLTDEIQTTLDNNPVPSNWRAFLNKAAELYTPYAFTKQEVENKFGSHIFHGSPSDRLISELGNRGMTVEELVEVLDHLQLENILVQLIEYESLYIIQQPASEKYVHEGDPFELEVKAKGFPYPRHQWFKLVKGEFTELTGMTEAVFKITSSSRTDAGTYCCRLHNGSKPEQCTFTNYSSVIVKSKPIETIYCNGRSNATGYVEKNCEPEENSYDPHSAECNDVVDAKVALPKILIGPSPKQVFKGEKVVFKCEAIGQSPLEYIWLRDHHIIRSKSEHNYLKIQNVSMDDEGMYHCKVMNWFGSTECQPFKLTVLEHQVLDLAPEKIEIISHPKTCSVDIGGTCIFSVTVAKTRQPLTYQWFKDGQQLNCKGSNSPELRLDNLQSLDKQGSYQCEVSAPNYRCLSNAASLNITIPSEPEYHPTDKVALLIGNYDYINEAPLKNAPKNDVQTMSEIFRSLGFRVISLLNLTKIEMESAVQEFICLLGKGVYGVFYYCGHGFEEYGNCYFVPPDARAGYTIEDCVSSEYVHNAMKKPEPAMALLILDICRIENKVKSEIPKSESYSSSSNNTPLEKGVSVFYYATSEKMCAYQDAQNGILVQHLQKFIMQHKGVNAVFNDVQNAWLKHPKHRDIQIPQIKANLLEYKRSLCDTVMTTGYTQAFQTKSLLWQRAHEFPESQTITINELGGMVVEVTFQSDFSNVIHIYTTVVEPGFTTKACAFLIDWTNQISIMGEVTVVSRSTKTTKMSLQDLQKLKEDLKVTLIVKYQKKGDDKDYFHRGERINLGRPLIAKLNLWKRRATEPMEHVEELDSTSDSKEFSSSSTC